MLPKYAYKLQFHKTYLLLVNIKKINFFIESSYSGFVTGSLLLQCLQIVFESLHFSPQFRSLCTQCCTLGLQWSDLGHQLRLVLAQIDVVRLNLTKKSKR